jgi:hypothetical protein
MTLNFVLLVTLSIMTSVGKEEAAKPIKDFLLQSQFRTLPLKKLGKTTENFEQNISCLNYEPEIVNLRGRVIRRVFSNLSNRRQTVYLLELNKPVCVNKDPANEFNIQRKNIQKMQLVLEDYNKAKKLIGKFVEVKGVLFGNHTQNHFTEVLISVNEIKSLK